MGIDLGIKAEGTHHGEVNQYHMQSQSRLKIHLMKIRTPGFKK
jgi:hypothetical protein